MKTFLPTQQEAEHGARMPLQTGENRHGVTLTLHLVKKGKFFYTTPGTHATLVIQSGLVAICPMDESNIMKMMSQGAVIQGDEQLKCRAFSDSQFILLEYWI